MLLLLLGVGGLLLHFCPNVVSRTSTLLNQSGNSEHPSLGPDFRGKSFQISTSLDLS